MDDSEIVTLLQKTKDNRTVYGNSEVESTGLIDIERTVRCNKCRNVREV